MSTLRSFKCVGMSLFFALHALFCFSQDFTWWNAKHNWDGVTHWHKYITISPGLMGPNALPVPKIKNGLLQEKSNFKFAAESHLSKGDKTANLFTELYIPLFTKRVGLNIQAVPLEYYNMDTLTRDKRKSRDYDGEGIAGGTIYVSTYIQLLEEKRNFPGVVITINLKTASGTNLYAARYTDTPGYYFDISSGKTVNIHNGFIESVRPYAMAGFYSWQTYRDKYYQNDAFLYGLGFDVFFSTFTIKNVLGGYIGYIGNGDKPMVYRMTISGRRNSLLNVEFRFQQGFADFNYTTLRLACNMDIQRIINQIKNKSKRLSSEIKILR